MDASPFIFPDWASLPQLVVQLISEKVKSIADYVRFRAVCSPWRSASLLKPCHLPPQLPWLMNPRWFSLKDDGTRLFYNPWESKIHKFHLPETSNMKCYASHRGRLLLATGGGSEVFLLNPLTRDRVHLPPFNTPVKHIRDCWDDPCNDFFIMHTSSLSVGKMTFSADLTDRDCLITVLLHHSRLILCCQVGDSCWTRVNICPNLLSEFVDVTYYNGQFYLLYKKAMEIIEPNKLNERIVYNFEPELEVVRGCLLEGELGVYMIGSSTLKEGINMFQFQEQPFKLKLMTNTNNRVLFNNGRIWLPLCSDDWDSTLDGDSMYMDFEYAPPVWGRKRGVWFQPSFV
ncbi:F-box family protein [Rhynchospora pubera]|uniref:F-box family protein n=1 Tax=Rhynchospora pubera TaxID=906938 RepID=A0AAV8GGY9_9POAL|nr:F-box family protein [Rhynchospora pubera]